MSYVRIPDNEGATFFPYVSTIAFSTDPEFWINPFSFKEIRYRTWCKIEMNGKLTFYVHLNAHEIDYFREALKEKTYVYGAYNQINVCQMRSWCAMRIAFPKEKETLFEVLENRTKGVEIEKVFPKEFSRQKILLPAMRDGATYCFTPETFESSGYVRG